MSKDQELGRIYGVDTIFALHQKYWLGDVRKVTMKSYLKDKFWRLLQLGYPLTAQKYYKLHKEKYKGGRL